MKKIALVDLKAGFETIKGEVMDAIESVFSEMNLYLGPNVQLLEEEFSFYCGTKYAIGVGSGTEALHIALLSCGIGKGDEVITSPNTFFATVEAIVHTGAKPVFVDIEPNTYTINSSLIKEKISSKTKAIIPVHMYGQSADMNPILELSKKYGLKVIEDACQAHGAEYNDKKCGSLGNVGCFSFYFTKNLGGYGEGGIIITNNEEIAEKARLYRNHGHKTKYEHAVLVITAGLMNYRQPFFELNLGILINITLYAEGLQKDIMTFCRICL